MRGELELSKRVCEGGSAGEERVAEWIRQARDTGQRVCMLAPNPQVSQGLTQQKFGHLCRCKADFQTCVPAFKC